MRRLISALPYFSCASPLTPNSSPLIDRNRHLDPLQRVIAAVTLHVHDLVGNLHTTDHFPEGCVLPVEEVCVGETDEELRAGTVGIIRARHRQHPAFVWLAVKLGFYLVAWSAHAMHVPIRILAVRIAALNHETGNHAMERRPVVKSLLGQVCKVLHVTRGDVMIEPQDDLSKWLSLARHRNRCAHLVTKVRHTPYPFFAYRNKKGGGTIPPSKPWLIGLHVSPSSSLRKAPALVPT